MTSHSIAWPPRLLQVVKTHLQCVEHEQYPSVPPLYSATHNIYDFFCVQHAALVSDMQSHGVEPAVTEGCIRMVIGLIEQSCALSFLQLRERRVVSTASIQKEKRMIGSTKSSGGHKRRRMEDVDDVFGGARFSRVLTLEYLLRMFVALPFIIRHYDKLGHSTTPEYAQAPLWTFVNVTLHTLETCIDQFYQPSSYIPLR